MTPRTSRPRLRARSASRAGVVGRAPAAGQADVHVDQHLADAAGARRRWSPRESTATVTRAPHSAIAASRPGRRVSFASSRSSPRPAAGHAHRSPAASRTNARCPTAACSAGERSHLCAFTWGRSARRAARRHRGEVVLRVVAVDDQRGRREVLQLHGRRRYWATAASAISDSSGARRVLVMTR